MIWKCVGDATVTVETGGAKMMRELRLGDKIRVVKPDGSLAWDDIYFFGHREDTAMGEFVRLALQEG